MLDGEKAMRAEAARRKADVDRRLAQAAADSAGAAALQAEQSALNAQLQQHSGQVRAAPGAILRLQCSPFHCTPLSPLQGSLWQPAGIECAVVGLMIKPRDKVKPGIICKMSR